MFKTIKINREKVKPITVSQFDSSKVKGANLFPEPYSNIFLLAKKKSGKTSVINKIVQKCTDKNTKFVIFCSTVHRDATWKHITKYLKDRGNDVQLYTSIKEEGQDMLADILKELKEKSQQEALEQEKEAEKQDEQPVERPDLEHIKIYDSENEEEPNENKKPRKPKKLSCEMMFILDDLGESTRASSVAELITTNRHYKAKVVISAQYPNFILPNVIKNLDYLLIFGKNKIDKIKYIHAQVDMSISFPTLVKLYKDATAQKYNFLWVETASENMRKNFNEQYDVDDQEDDESVSKDRKYLIDNDIL